MHQAAHHSPAGGAKYIPVSIEYGATHNSEEALCKSLSSKNLLVGRSIYVYIYIYRERERENHIERDNIIKGSLDEKLPIYEQDPKSKRLDSFEKRFVRD